MNLKKYSAFILMLFCTTFLMAQTEKRFSLSFSNIPLSEAMPKVEKASGYTFFYNPAEVNIRVEVSLSVQNETVRKAMDKMLNSVGIGFEITNSQIVLFPSNKKSTGTQGGKVTVKGKVVDATGEPIIGANVVEKGTVNGVITDIDGNYQLSVSKDASLLVSYIGYVPQTIKAGTKTEICLVEDSKTLDEVVVVGFGTQKKVNLTGAVASVSSEALANKPVANIGQALQGVIPNLNVSATSASPGAVPSFNVRGGTSMSQDSDGKWQVDEGSPLILVDGIQMDATYLNMLNPNDIESISLLKDAASAAIYGARATYGVMLVTTKSGQKEQRPTVTYNFSMQWNTPSHRPDIMDAYTLQLAENERTEWTGNSVSDWSMQLLEAKKKWMENPTAENAWIYQQGSTSKFSWVSSMNPFEEVVRDWTPLQKHTASISGGTAKSRYYLSLGYQHQEGMYKINTDKQNRFNGLMSIDSEITKWFKINAKISYNVSNLDEPYINAQKGSLWSAMMGEPERNVCAPVKTAATDPMGEMWTDNIIGWLAYGATKETKRTNAVFSINPTITLMDGLSLKGEFSYRPNEYYYKEVIPTREYVVDNWTSTVKTHTDPSSILEQVTHSDYYTINAYANFDKTFGKHYVGAVAGFNQEWYTYRYTGAKAQGILTPNIPVINAATGNQYAYDSAEHWAIRGAFARVNYIFNDRYLFEFNGRYDGTSRFRKEDRFKFFPSFSAGWRVSEESFIKNNCTWLDNLKLRASWGSLGNQNVSNYAYIPEYGSVGFVSWNMGGSRPMGISPSGLISPNLTWETATTIDFGIDVALLGNRLDLTFDWYSRRTKDILMAGDKYPSVLGASAPKKNSGVLRTNGWELSLKWKDRLANGLNYDVSFVLSDYITKVVRFDGNPNKLLSSLYAGKTMGEIWGYNSLGILQEDDFVTDENGKQILQGASQSDLGSTWYPGDLRFEDYGGKESDDEHRSSVGADGKVSTGQNTIYNPGDRKVIGNSTPRFRFGLNGNVSWKNISLGIFFQGVAKRDVCITDRALWGGNNTSGNRDTYNNSWRPDRTNAKYHMYGRTQNSSIAHTGNLYNAAYIRLKTLSLGYSLPKSWVTKVGMNSVTLNLSGYNLFEISGVPDVFDPESISSSYPMMRSVSVGAQINF